ncbi:MAG: ATP-binding protein [Acidobacteriota bacterium]|nr:ATP-binding protein [Acidobacteriota bacterium]
MADSQELSALRAELDTANRQLVEAHKMASLGRLLAGIVHEINTPIGSILSNNEVILRSLDILKKHLGDGQPASMQKAKDILETCRGLAAVDKIACERISSIIRGLKTFSRVDTADLKKIDLRENIENTLKLTHGEFRRRITVETDFGDVPPVECHPQMLNQVFLNTIVNAGQAIDGEGKVTIRTRLESDRVHISISDTGKGIAPEDRAKIFSAGFTTKPVGVGTGLGLNISKQIVEEAHHGSLDFDSEPGAGTTFHIRIPVRQTANQE